MEVIWRELRYALRQLRHSPAFALSVMLTLMVAIGANTAIFSVVYAVLIAPLPYSEPDRLLCIWNADRQTSPWYSFSYPGFEHYREQLRGVADVAAYDDEIATVWDRGEAIRVEGGRVSANFFAVLGVKPALGRGFVEAEDRHRADPVALLSDHFWRQRYGADRHILGRSITVDGEAFTIIGVMPPGMQFQNAPVDVWRSRIVDTRTFAPSSVQMGARYLTVVGRLDAGVSVAQFRARLQVVNTQRARQNLGDAEVAAEPLQPMLVANVRGTVLLLWGAVACLMVIACANVANLVLARVASRERDISVRVALGAGQWRIARQWIVESVLLTLASAVLSLPLALGGMRWLTAALQQNSLVVADTHLDWRVLLATLAAGGAIGILFGLTPVWVLRRSAAFGEIGAGGRRVSASRWSSRWRGGVVAGQLAVCLVLLAGAGLLVESFIRMNTMATGIRTDHVATFPLDLMPDRYESFDRRAGFYDDVLRRVETIPGVKGASIASRVDLVSHGLGYVVQVEGNAETAAHPAGTRGRSVSADYFRVLGIPLLRGRVFDEHDGTHSGRVAVINQAFARKFFGDVDPVGKHVTYSTDRITCEIVGVVGDVRGGLQETGPEDELYLPLAQRPWLVGRLLVRTENLAGVAAAIRERVRAADPQQAVAESAPLDQVVSERLARPRTTMMVVAAFAGAALFLAAVGIYGVIAYSVAQRRKEIGIRMALGADAPRIRTMLFGQTVRMFAGGLVAGLPLAAGISRLYASLLFDVQPGDPVTLGGAVVVLFAVAWLATFVPALGASRSDPLTVLRAE